MKFCLIRKKSSSVRIYFDLKAFSNVNTSGIEARVLERDSGTRKFFSRSHRKPFISNVSIIPDDKENVRSKETNDSSIKMNYNESLDYSIYNDSHWLHILCYSQAIEIPKRYQDRQALARISNPRCITWLTASTCSYEDESRPRQGGS